MQQYRRHLERDGRMASAEVTRAIPSGRYAHRDMRALYVSVLLALATGNSAMAAVPPSAAIAVLDFELNDLTLDARNPAELERTASIKPMLEKALAAAGYPIVPVALTEQHAADKGVGYLFDHADTAAVLGRAAGADWVIVGRVHKASFLFVYFKVHVVNVGTGEQVADLVVEVKGPQKALTGRGVESLALQIDAAIKEQAPTAIIAPIQRPARHDLANFPLIVRRP